MINDEKAFCPSFPPASFVLDSTVLTKSPRVFLGEWTAPALDALSCSLDQLARLSGHAPVQRGRVIAVRQTDDSRLYSSFKTSLYHGHFDDMQNGLRFLKNIAPRHQSYEPIRGETILFLFVGVSRMVYENLILFCQGRTGRFAGGFRHTLPWGVEVPPSVVDPASFAARNMPRVRSVVASMEKAPFAEEADLLRAELPLCYIPGPFALEFSEEALVKKVFKQRLWEPGAEERMGYDVLEDMWECCLALDREKFQTLYELNGPHVYRWEDAMRTLRDEDVDFASLMGAETGSGGTLAVDGSLKVFDALEAYFASSDGGFCGTYLQS